MKRVLFVFTTATRMPAVNGVEQLTDRVPNFRDDLC